MQVGNELRNPEEAMDHVTEMSLQTIVNVHQAHRIYKRLRMKEHWTKQLEDKSDQVDTETALAMIKFMEIEFPELDPGAVMCQCDIMEGAKSFKEMRERVSRDGINDHAKKHFQDGTKRYVSVQMNEICQAMLNAIEQEIESDQESFTWLGEDNHVVTQDSHRVPGVYFVTSDQELVLKYRL